RNKKQRWYERQYDANTNKESWDWGPSLLGRKEIWRDATRSNALFLSTAIQLNNEQLRPVFNWFSEKLAVILPNALILPQWTLDQCKDSSGKDRVLELLNAADLSIDDIEIELKKGQHISVTFDTAKGVQTQVTPDHDVQIIKFRHKANQDGDSTLLDAGDESTGTQRLFALAGPWLDVLAKGRVLFVDELDNSLHPLIVRFLIGLFHDPSANKGNAQLVVATHDTSLLDAELYRRDQIWFIEKDEHNASHLYPLTDFSPRKEEALEKGYLKGRYGALPFLGEVRI
ncbi:MAG: AAA family ATPase, partial [Burkholderiales bacterium]